MSNRSNNIYVKREGNWTTLPKWACFYFNIGRNFYSNLGTERRLRVVLTLPTRLYAGVFIAAGAVLESISNNNVDAKIIDEHFQNIKRLEIGTSVIFRRGNRTYRGIFSGIAAIQGEERLKITIQAKKAGNLTEYLNPKQALSVQVAAEKNYKLPKNPKGRKNEYSNFLTIGFQEYNYERLYIMSQLLFLYIGRKKIIKDEVMNTELAVYDRGENKFIPGNINELLRIKEFVGEQDSFQSQFFSSSITNHEVDVRNINPSTFTIFDGGMSYLRWRETFKNTHSILILDRTETQFETVINELYEEYVLSNKVIKDFPIEKSIVPNGVEIMAWEVF